MPSRFIVSALRITGTMRPLPSASSTAMPRLTNFRVTIESPRSSPLMYGKSFSVSTAARAMNARYVGLTPYEAWYSFFSTSRAATTFDMSTSIALVTCAAVSSERRMCSAMPRRIAVTGSTCSPACVTAAAPAAERSRCGCGASRRRAGGAGVGWRSTNAKMSCFVTRPPRPVPGTWLGSMPCSAAMRATTGETNLPFPVGCCTGTRGSGSAGGCASATGSGSGAAAGSGSGAGAGAPAAPPICASFVPTATVSPSWTRICVTVPEAGLGTSVSTLSVEISSSGSSASICSPSRLSHFVIVPSETETPICGMTTSTAVSVAIS